GGSAIATVALAGLLLMAILRFYLPVRYELSDDGVCERILGQRRELHWERVRQIEIGKSAARLSTRRAKGWLSRLGAMTIPLDEAPAAARAHLGERAE